MTTPAAIDPLLAIAESDETNNENPREVVTVVNGPVPPTVFTWAAPVAGNWSDASKWINDQSSGTGPIVTGQADYSLHFDTPATGTYTTTNNLNSGFLLNQLDFHGSTVTLAGNSLSFTANGAAFPQIHQNASSEITISTPLTLASDLTVGGAGDGAVTISGAISGAGGLTKTGSGPLTLSAANTYTGTTSVSGGSLVLADDSQLKFVVDDSPAANMVTGSGTATFNGDFNIDTTAVVGTTGHIWLLVDRANLTGESFGSTFSVIGFADPEDDGVWTMSDPKGDWSFDEATGELTLDAATDYDTWGAPYGLTVGSEGGDLDNDGLTNQQEYAFGLVPNSELSANPITMPLDLVAGTFTYTRRNPALTGLAYPVYTSPDLLTWAEDTGATQSVIATNGDVQTVQVTLSVPAAFIKGYTVLVGGIAANSSNNILSFGPGAVINGTNITWTVPSGTDLTNLAPTYTISPLAFQDPDHPSGSSRNFTTPQTYTITAQNGSTQTYTVTVAAAPSNGPDLTIDVSAPATATVGVPFEYTFTARNIGNQTATDITIGIQPGAPLTPSSIGTLTGTNGFTGGVGSNVVFYGGTLAPGETATLTMQVTASQAATITLPPASVTIDFTGSITEANEANNNPSQTVSTVVTVPVSAPTITTHPASQTIPSGTSATLTVIATGTGPFTYQWYQGISGDTTTPVGIDSVNFTTPVLTSTTSYWVRATNGGGAADSDTATIIVSQGNDYETWASVNAGAQSFDLDFDADGVKNGIEYFMGVTGFGFTPLPDVVNTGGFAGISTITWTKATGYPGIYGTDFVVEISSTSTGPWFPIALGASVGINGNYLTYTFPPASVHFARLSVFGSGGTVASTPPLRYGWVNMDYVTVGNPGNTSDPTTGYGAVGYTYKIGKYEVTNAQYTDFLNAVDPSGVNPNGIHNPLMDSDPRGGIAFNAAADNGSKYSTRSNMANKPVGYVSWYDSARFINWLHNGQGTADTETGAYTLTGNVGIISRNPGATVWLPGEDEWYKAAYYDATPGASGDNYWLYATQSDTAPTIASASPTGDVVNPGPNVANYARGADWNGQDGMATTIGSAAANNFYGTSDQSGNVWEWNEAVINGSQRGRRGGSYAPLEDNLRSSYRLGEDPTLETGSFLGFRVAARAELSPLITTQPASQTIASGTTATLTVATTGTEPLTYQWYQGISGDTTTPVGTNSASFTSPGLSANTSYWVRVTNIAGSVDSDTATIRINLLANGSFEQPALAGGLLSVFAPNASSIPAWTVSQGDIELIRGDWTASDGLQSLDMSGVSAGTIHQDVGGLVPGGTYRIQFDLSGNPTKPSTLVKSLRVSAAGQSGEFEFDVTSTSSGNMGWIGRQMDFVAASATARIQFESLTPGDRGAALDHVSLVLVAPPTSAPPRHHHPARRPDDPLRYRGHPIRRGDRRSRSNLPMVSGKQRR